MSRRPQTHLRDLGAVLALFVAANRTMLLAGMALACLTVLAGIALLGLSGWFITATALAGLSATTALAFDVFSPAAAIRFLALARTAARYGERLVSHDAALGVLATLRERLFRGWAEPGAAGHLMRRPARLLFRLTLDIDALDSLYLRVLLPAAAALGVLLAVALAFALIHPLAGLAAAVLLAVGLAIPLVAASAARRPSRLRAETIEVLRARAIDLVAGQTELVMTGRLRSARDAVIARDRRLASLDDRLNKIETSAGIGFGVLGSVLLAGTLAAAAALAEAGRIGAPVAALAVLVALGAVEPFAALRRGALELGRSLLAAGRISPRLQAAPTAAPMAMPVDGVALALNHVSVRPDGAMRPTLEDVTLAVGAGERIALVGPSGAGKSTLLAVIAGEIAPETGPVSARPATLLTQRTELFQDSLRDNLRLAAPDASDARLGEALDMAGLGDDVRRLPRGLDTRLGEGGHGLSGGQARRLAVARLLLRDTPVWLLDEPTEGLDGATARDVLARLSDRAAGRALVIATHIRREAAIADRLVIVDRGRLVATHHRGEPGFDAALAALRPD